MVRDSSSRGGSPPGSWKNGGLDRRSSKSARALPEHSSRLTRRRALVRVSNLYSTMGSMPDQLQRVRIAIADDHPIFRDGLKRLLESEPGFEVVAEASDGIDAIRIAHDAQPDVLLLDVAMPRMGGL